MDRKQVLIEYYCDKSMTQKEIATLLGCDQGNLSREMRNLGIPTRSQSESQKRYWRSSVDTTKQRNNLIPGGFKGHHWMSKSIAIRNARSSGLPRHAYNDEFRRKSSESHKKNPNRYWFGKKRPEVNQWLNSDEARAKCMSSMHLRPNKPEKKLMELLDKYLPNQYKFVGDGTVIIGGLCPDFININGKKLIIELFGDYWHNPKLRNLNLNQTVEGRKEIFKDFGFRTLILWEHEINTLSEASLVERIMCLEVM